MTYSGLKKILVTGANGFIGRALCARLVADGFLVQGAVREVSGGTNLPQNIEVAPIGSIGPDTNWKDFLTDVDFVIHLAARVHILQDTDRAPLQAFRRVNLQGTERLAQQAAHAGVKRFVFMSTIGVNGSNSGSSAFSESDEPMPHNAYSVSKLEAETRLKEINTKTGMEIVIVRSPLVYGPGNPGNFLSLLRVIAKGIPLPLASVSNIKSFTYVKNLADALICCSLHPKAAGQMYIVSDGVDVSTPELVRSLAAALCKPSRLFPFQPSLIRFAGKLTGKSEAVDRLLSSLTVDISKIRRELGWEPTYTMEQGLRETAEWFKKTGKR